MKLQALVFLSLVFLISCSAEHDGLGSSTGSSFSKNPSPDPGIVSAAKAVIDNQCFACHNNTSGTNTRFIPDNGSGETDMDALVDTSRVQIGIPLGSSLFTYFQTMPPGTPLGTSSSEGVAVSDWITEMGIPTSSSDVTFTQVWTQTLEPKCLDCHASDASGGPAGGIAFDGYSDLIGGLVVAGSSSTSLIVNSIANRMPKETRGSTGKVTNPGHQYFVSQAELDNIIDWIDGGAFND